MGRHRYILIVTLCLVTIALSAGCIGCAQGGILVEEFPICTDSARQGAPAISGHIVVWRDGRNEGFDSIYGYNLDTKTEFLICTVEKTQRINATIANPDIDGNIVVWQQLSEASGYDIWAYNLETEEKFPVCTDKGSQVEPKISGNFVLWLERVEPVVYRICAYNLVTSEMEFSTSAGGYHEGSFDISGATMVWEGNPINAYNLESRHEFTIPVEGFSPRIDGNTVIWIDYSPTSPLWREGRAGDLVAYDLTTQEESRLPETWTYIFFPAVSGDFIVWTNDIYQSQNIDGYDLYTGSEFAICGASKEPRDSPDIDGDIVVWADQRNGQVDIYGAKISRVSK